MNDDDRRTYDTYMIVKRSDNLGVTCGELRRQFCSCASMRPQIHLRPGQMHWKTETKQMSAQLSLLKVIPVTTGDTRLIFRSPSNAVNKLPHQIRTTYVMSRSL